MKLARSDLGMAAGLLFALVLALPAGLGAETQAEIQTETQTTAAAAETTRHSLWMVETEQNRIYLLGSLHVLKKESYPLPEAVEKAYLESPVVVFEADVDELNDPSLAQTLIAKGLYPEGVTLQDALPEDLYDELWGAVSKAGLDMKQVERMKPWLCSLQLASVELDAAGFKPKYGVDNHFFERAKEDEKERIYLETAEYQLDLLSNLSKPLQEELLAQTLQELDQIKTVATEMQSAWRAGEVERLEQLMLESFEEYPKLRGRLLTRRNRNWIPEIEKLMTRDEDCLVVVGTLHLIGEKSVVSLLREKGYEVVQL
jgi:uncharacterized protein YbaP (TraB family)